MESFLSTLNTNAARIQALWISFVSFGAYLTITILGTTHEILLLEKPVRLPGFNIDLPLISFYFIAPILFLIFHFYALTQLLLLARTASAFEKALRESSLDERERDVVRMRLDNSVFLQLLSGSDPERHGRNAWLIRWMAMLTMIILPVTLLVVVQLQFLPYHHAQLTNIHRAIITIDILMIFLLWPAYSRGWGLPSRALYLNVKDRRSVIAVTRATAGVWVSLLVIVAVWFVAVYPSERHYNNWIARIPSLFGLQTFTAMLLEPQVDYVAGAHRGFFSNILVLPDKRFVDVELAAKLDQLEAGANSGESRLLLSFRGRDLANAELPRADLRRSDFTGANLDGANLEGAALQHSKLGCADRGVNPALHVSDEDWPPENCTRLRKTRLVGAKLHGAQIVSAHMQEAELNYAEFHDARLTRAHMQGAVLASAAFHGADLEAVGLQGAILNHAEFLGSTLRRVDFHGAMIIWAKFHGASLQHVQFFGTVLDTSEFFGARLDDSNFDGASLLAAKFRSSELRQMGVWRSQMTDAEFSNTIVAAASVDPPSERRANARRDIGAVPDGLRDLVLRRFARLEAAADPDDWQADKNVWMDEQRREQMTPAAQKLRAEQLREIVCREAPSARVARYVIKSGILKNLGTHIQVVADGLQDPLKCPGAKGLKAEDFTHLAEQRERATGAINRLRNVGPALPLKREPQLSTRIAGTPQRDT